MGFLTDVAAECFWGWGHGCSVAGVAVVSGQLNWRTFWMTPPRSGPSLEFAGNGHNGW